MAKAKGLEREMRGKLWNQKRGGKTGKSDGDFKVKEIFSPSVLSTGTSTFENYLSKQKIKRFIVLLTFPK